MKNFFKSIFKKKIQNYSLKCITFRQHLDDIFCLESLLKVICRDIILGEVRESSKHLLDIRYP